MSANGDYETEVQRLKEFYTKTNPEKITLCEKLVNKAMSTPHGLDKMWDILRKNYPEYFKEGVPDEVKMAPSSGLQTLSTPVLTTVVESPLPAADKPDKLETSERKKNREKDKEERAKDRELSVGAFTPRRSRDLFPPTVGFPLERARLNRFYSQFAPHKCGDVNSIVKKYGAFGVSGIIKMWRDLEKTYNVPMPPYTPEQLSGRGEGFESDDDDLSHRFHRLSAAVQSMTMQALGLPNIRFPDHVNVDLELRRVKAFLLENNAGGEDPLSLVLHSAAQGPVGIARMWDTLSKHFRAEVPPYDPSELGRRSSLRTLRVSDTDEEFFYPMRESDWHNHFKSMFMLFDESRLADLSNFLAISNPQRSQEGYIRTHILLEDKYGLMPRPSNAISKTSYHSQVKDEFPMSAAGIAQLGSLPSVNETTNISTNWFRDMNASQPSFKTPMTDYSGRIFDFKPSDNASYSGHTPERPKFAIRTEIASRLGSPELCSPRQVIRADTSLTVVCNFLVNLVPKVSFYATAGFNEDDESASRRILFEVLLQCPSPAMRLRFLQSLLQDLSRAAGLDPSQLEIIAITPGLWIEVNALLTDEQARSTVCEELARAAARDSLKLPSTNYFFARHFLAIKDNPNGVVPLSVQSIKILAAARVSSRYPLLICPGPFPPSGDDRNRELVAGNIFSTRIPPYYNIQLLGSSITTRDPFSLPELPATNDPQQLPPFATHLVLPRQGNLPVVIGSSNSARVLLAGEN